MVNFYPITVNEYQNTCQSKREREKKKNYSPLVAIAFSTNGASYKKKKQHKTIFIKKKYMYNVMLHFFLEKNNKTYQNVYTELRMLVCR